MSITINGNGTITGYDPVPNGSITTAKIADNAVTTAKTTGLQRRIATAITLPTNAGNIIHNVTTGVKKIEIVLSEVSSNNNSQLHVQVGTGGDSFDSTGYGHAMGFHRTGTSSREATVSNSTGAFASYGLDSSNYHIFGKWELNNPHGNYWVSDFTVWGSDATNHQFWGTGYKQLSSTLSQIKFYIGSGNFDNGYLTIIETMGDD